MLCEKQFYKSRGHNEQVSHRDTLHITIAILI